jgi:hypothetical protein
MAGDTPLARVRVFFALDPTIVAPPLLDGVLALAQSFSQLSRGVPLLLLPLTDQKLMDARCHSLQGCEPISDNLEELHN